MSDAEDTFVSPSGALDAASRLTTTGSSFATRWSELQAMITGLNGQAPWGNDEPGRTFAQHYSEGDEPAESTLRTAMSDLSTALSEVGPSITASVNGTVDDDEGTGRSMAV